MQTQPIVPLSNPVLIEYSQMQLTYIKEALHDDPYKDHRWNIKSGATQCGKTSVDFMYVIPYRIYVRKNLKGALLITGVSLGTIERNVLEPMRDYWLEKGFTHYVSEIHKDRAGNSYVNIRGQKVYLCGMLNKTAISRLRGAKFKYVYCDEIAEYNEDAFGLLKSRLSLPYSCVDGACNPESDTHWLYAFIHSNIDLYLQEYTIFDNPFLSKKYVEELCKEYAGSVLYDRYILGKWKKAEGLVYKILADNPQDYILYEIPPLAKIVMGVDFGGNGSAHTFVATGYGFRMAYIVILESKRVNATGLNPNELNEEFEKFVNMVKNKYNVSAFECYCDSAEQTLINGFQTLSKKHSLGVIIKNACKRKITDRIKLVLRLLGSKRLYFMFSAQTSLNAMSTCVYNSKVGHQDERLDDGTTDIDSVDATEYTIEPEMATILKQLETTIPRTVVNTLKGATI